MKISKTHWLLSVAIVPAISLNFIVTEAAARGHHGGPGPAHFGQTPPPPRGPQNRPMPQAEPDAPDTPDVVIAPPLDASLLSTLGEALFFDPNLSNPVGQSCASCHAPAVAFTDPDNSNPTSQGVIDGRFGARNSPTAMYAAMVPEFRFDVRRQRFIGGLFLDGRASNLEEQAKAPFTNALEMNNPDAASVVEKVRQANYASLFTDTWGSDALDNDEQAFERIAAAIAAFERTQAMSPFNSKFDAVMAGQATFTPAEQRGSQLFFGRARCVTCHNTRGGGPQVFSDFSYENLGVPANLNNPFYAQASEFNPDGSDFIDNGLGAVVGMPQQNGKFRVPTLRNIEHTGPYMHNGIFNTLREVVHFYNARDIDPGFAEPEVADNVTQRGGVGNLGLNGAEEADLVSFLRTLSDF